MKHYKKELIAFFILVGSFTGLKAQQAFLNCGGNATGSGGTVSYSMGQIADTSISNTNGAVNQGVQQPYEFFVQGINDLNDIHLELLVYPNPTSESVILKVKSDEIENLNYQVFDIGGKLILNKKINSAETTIPLTKLPSATYFIKVINNNKEIKSFKIIKNI